MNRQSLDKPLMPLLAQAQILLKHWLDDERIRPVDWHLARQAVEYEIDAGNTSDTALTALLFAACSCSYVLGRGQVCIDINRWVLPEVSDETVRHVMSAENMSCCQVVKIDDDKNTQQNSDTNIEGVKHQQTRTPLFVLNNNRLYLSRYFSYEQLVLNQLSSRLSLTHLDDNGVQESSQHIEALANYLQILFPKTNQGHKTNSQDINDLDINDLEINDLKIDWQAIAAAVACTQPVTVITGGPGTGKTTTVTKLLSALLNQTPDLRIALAAPTGKAAARMTESIRQARTQMADTTGMHGIPTDSYTLHRLLGWSPRGFRYNAKRHLPFDCVVVDEASMIDLPMMAHLFSALSPSTRIILLGDRDQLASVEAGSVLADLCDAGTDHGFTPAFSTYLSKLVGIELHSYLPQKGSSASVGAHLPMQNAVVQLRKSHRFSADSGIGALARAVNAGDQNAAATAFNHFDDVQWLVPEGKSWQRKVLEGYRNYCTLVQENASAEEILNAFDEFQVLVALRKGNWGVEETNRQIERLLSNAGLLKGTTQQWYSGRAVMITRNDYDLGLFNGDIGILVKLEDSDTHLIERVAFRAADGGVRYMSPGRLPSHETAFAITVHKSQGSEFRDVLLLLPEQWQQVITRELIYTAITRAKLSFCCQAGDVCWAQGLNTQVLRASGLRDALWGQ